MAFELTLEQQAVVSESSKRLTVRASAGAGKTSVPVRRYLRHVQEDGFRADQILTITFTRKAAAEMKSRIVKSLLDAGLPDQGDPCEPRHFFASDRHQRRHCRLLPIYRHPYRASPRKARGQSAARLGTPKDHW